MIQTPLRGLYVVYSLPSYTTLDIKFPIKSHVEPRSQWRWYWTGCSEFGLRITPFTKQMWIFIDSLLNVCSKWFLSLSFFIFYDYYFKSYLKKKIKDGGVGLGGATVGIVRKVQPWATPTAWRRWPTVSSSRSRRKRKMGMGVGWRERERRKGVPPVEEGGDVAGDGCAGGRRRKKCNFNFIFLFLN